jgi:uncharacterized membrane protein
MTARPARSSGARAGRRFEWRLGRLLIVVTYVAVTLLLIGTVLLLAAGVSPLSGGPPLDPSRLLADLVRLAPTGFLWLGLLAVIATPVTRVLGAVVGFMRGGERVMAAISVAILAVIAIGVLAALLGR